VLALLALIVVASAVARADEPQSLPPVPMDVPDSIACSRCRIEVTPGVLIETGTTGAPLSSFPAAVRIDGRGRYWVLAAGSTVILDLQAGQSLRRLAHDTAAVPYAADAIQLPGDSMLVVDGRSGRAVVFDSHLNPARAIAYPFPDLRGVVVRWPDRVVLSGPILTPDAAGFPLHIVSFAGNRAVLVESFGTDGSLAFGSSAALRWTLLADGDSGYWAAELGAYRVTHWSSNNTLQNVVVRRPTWFPESRNPRLGGPAQPPSSVIAGFDVDAERVLWVFSRVARERWRDAWPVRNEGLSDLPITGAMIDQLYHTVVEAIDLRSMHVIARDTIGSPVLAVLPGPNVVVRRGGLESLQLLNVRIVR
jgi:hypothetical protein